MLCSFVLLLAFLQMKKTVQSVEGMKLVCHELDTVTNDPESSGMEEIMKDTDRLVSCLANKVIKWL